MKKDADYLRDAIRYEVDPIVRKQLSDIYRKKTGENPVISDDTATPSLVD